MMMMSDYSCVFGAGWRNGDVHTRGSYLRVGNGHCNCLFVTLHNNAWVHSYRKTAWILSNNPRWVQCACHDFFQSICSVACVLLANPFFYHSNMDKRNLFSRRAQAAPEAVCLSFRGNLYKKNGSGREDMHATEAGRGGNFFKAVEPD